MQLKNRFLLGFPIQHLPYPLVSIINNAAAAVATSSVVVTHAANPSNHNF